MKGRRAQSAREGESAIKRKIEKQSVCGRKEREREKAKLSYLVKVDSKALFMYPRSLLKAWIKSVIFFSFIRYILITYMSV